jgi:NAD(P)-dependent dehydrogenase (short-subunit alcohol dehydrogenase family)
MLDITDQAHLAALADALPDRLDALVNNAAFGLLGPVEGLTTDDLRNQFEVNLVGQVGLTQAVLPRLRVAAGRIVFISSVGGRSVIPMEGAYCASKAALEAVADALRVELRPWNISVSVIEPGPTDTERWREVGTMIDDMESRLAPRDRELYDRHIAGLRANVARFGSATTPPDAVARAVERALTARRPRARYPVGAPAHTMIAMNAVLPARLGDAISARIAGLR